MAEFEMDMTPYVLRAMKQIDALVDERFKEHFKQAFNAGRMLGREEGSQFSDPTDPPDFEEWFVMYVERLKRDGFRVYEG